MATLDTLNCVNLEGLSDQDLALHEATYYLLADFCSATRHARFARKEGRILSAEDYEKMAERYYTALPDNLKW